MKSSGRDACVCVGQANDQSPIEERLQPCDEGVYPRLDSRRVGVRFVTRSDPKVMLRNQIGEQHFKDQALTVLVAELRQIHHRKRAPLSISPASSMATASNMCFQRRCSHAYGLARLVYRCHSLPKLSTKRMSSATCASPSSFPEDRRRAHTLG